MAEEAPSELTILLKIVEVVELSLRKSGDKQLSNNERTQIVQITNKFGAGSVFESFIQNATQDNQETTVGDQYTTGQAGAVGPGASAQHMNFNQIWNQAGASLDLDALAKELETLRIAMRQKATEAEHDLATAEVAHAELAASKGDGPTVLLHLSRAGRWALTTATAIGTGVAAAAIKSALGL